LFVVRQRAFSCSDILRDTELKLLLAAWAAERFRLLWLSVDGTRPAEPQQEVQALADPARRGVSLTAAKAAAAIARMAQESEGTYRWCAADQPVA
jgi:hypothetical protein